MNECICECLCVHVIAGYFIFEIFILLSSFITLDYFL